MNYCTKIDAACDVDELFFQQHPTRNYFIRPIELAEINERLRGVEVLGLPPQGMRYFAVIKRGYLEVPVAMFHVDAVDAPVDRDEESCRAIFVGSFPHEPLPCFGCGVDTAPQRADRDWPLEGAQEFYMVRDEVWGAADMPQCCECPRDEPRRYLCIACLESRIGRMLTPEDFADGWRRQPNDLDSPRLRSRMTGEPEQ